METDIQRIKDLISIYDCVRGGFSVDINEQDKEPAELIKDIADQLEDHSKQAEKRLTTDMPWVAIKLFGGAPRTTIGDGMFYSQTTENLEDIFNAAGMYVLPGHGTTGNDYTHSFLWLYLSKEAFEN